MNYFQFKLENINNIYIYIYYNERGSFCFDYYYSYRIFYDV